MADQKPVEAAPKEMKEAEALWGSFMSVSKISIVLISIILIGLALAFVPFG